MIKYKFHSINHSVKRVLYIGSAQNGKSLYTECKNKIERRLETIKKVYDEMQAVNGFCYLEDRLSARGECEAVVTWYMEEGIQ